MRIQFVRRRRTSASTAAARTLPIRTMGRSGPSPPPLVEPLNALNTLAAGDDPPLADAAETDEAGRWSSGGPTAAAATGRSPRRAPPRRPRPAPVPRARAGSKPGSRRLRPRCHRTATATAGGPARPSRMARGAAHGVHGICRPPAARGRDRLDVLAYAGVPRRGKRATGRLSRGRNGKQAGPAQSQRASRTGIRSTAAPADSWRVLLISAACRSDGERCAELQPCADAGGAASLRATALPASGGGGPFPFAWTSARPNASSTGGAAAGGVGQPCVVNAWTSPR